MIGFREQLTLYLLLLCGTSAPKFDEVVNVNINIEEECCVREEQDM